MELNAQVVVKPLWNADEIEEGELVGKLGARRLVELSFVVAVW